MEKRLGTLTLGVRDLARSRAFYEQGLGWTRDGGEDDIAFYQLNGLVLSLYEWPKLAIDAGVDQAGSGFRGVVLAYCVRERDELEGVLAEAQAAGGRDSRPSARHVLGRQGWLFRRSRWSSLGGAVESAYRDNRARRTSDEATSLEPATSCRSRCRHFANFLAPATQATTASVTASISGLTCSCSSVAASARPKKGCSSCSWPDRGDAALRQAAIPEHEADQHAEQRDIGETDPGGASDAGEGRRPACTSVSTSITGSDSTSAQEITCQPPSLRDSFAPSA